MFTKAYSKLKRNGDFRLAKYMLIVIHVKNCIFLSMPRTLFQTIKTGVDTVVNPLGEK